MKTLGERKSKTQLKREALARQRLGERLVGLNVSQLETLPIDPELREAVLEAQRLGSRQARRRQLQLVGKHMRSANAAEIARALQSLHTKHQAAVDRFHELERWRERLLTENPAVLKEFLHSYPNADRQHLRQLIHNARGSQEFAQSPGSSRKLFLYLRLLLGGS